jgi:8-oxo-dGTP diphosphatase
MPGLLPRIKEIDVVAGLIYRDGRLLVCQRHRDSVFALKWEFPGGKVEKGEADIEALRRELQEELDIEIGEANLIGSHEHCYPGGPKVTLKFFCVRQFAGEMKNLVFEKIQWTKLANLERLDFLDGDRPLVQRLAGDSGAKLLTQQRQKNRAVDLT